MSYRPGSWFRPASTGPAKGLLALAATLAASPISAQVTRAELTEFRETSSYADVQSFLDSLQRADPGIRVGTLAISAEGRQVPYVFVSHPLVSSPSEARRSGKLVV